MKSETPKFRNLELLGAALASVFLSVAHPTRGWAEDASRESPQIAVSIGDLNLKTPEGVTVLRRRVRAAAVLVCDPPGPRELAQLVRSRSCVTEATARAIADVKAHVSER